MKLWAIALVAFWTAAIPAADFRLNIAPSGSRVALDLTGESGAEYVFESALELPTGPGDDGHDHTWRSLGSMRLSGETGQWLTDMNPFQMRFFRARFLESPAVAANFRMIDHLGVSRELRYFQTAADIRAIVLVFADGNYSSFASKIAALRTNPSYTSSVLFWTVEVGPARTRAEIVASAQAAGISWPVFHDPMSLVTREYDAHYSGEAFLIARSTMRIIYRGAIDDGAGNNYLANALAAHFAQQPITVTSVGPASAELPRAERPVPGYSTVIAPLLQSKCVTCHSPDNIAPFAMTSHEVVRSYASLIKQQVMTKQMPPWHADPHYGTFRNDISLSNEQAAQLLDWIAAGAPRGEGPDPLTNIPPDPPEWPAELGPPDEVVSVPLQTIQATGTVAYRHIYVNSANPTDRWVRAAVVKPTNRRVVHHYLVWQGHTSFGFSGMAGYAPGRTEGAYPEGAGVLLPARSPLTFNLHYTATGQAETDLPQMGLWYYDTPPPRALRNAVPLNFFFSIPPGARDHQVSASFNFTRNSTIYSFNPHMHLRGLRMRFELVLPTGSRQTLLSVPKYDFNWQTIYYLAQPLDVPSGARIEVIGAFDNSAQNPFNPNPNITVAWGEQSWEEMFIGYMDYAER